MNAVRIGGLSVGDVPRVVGTVSSEECLRALDVTPPPCDIAELRLDLFPAPLEPRLGLCGAIRSKGIPVILTIRAGNDGGGWLGPVAGRTPLFLRALPSVAALDLELKNGVPAELLAAGAGSGAALIVSHHDFEKTPPLEELRSRVREARELGASVVKVATFVRSEADLAVLAALTEEEAREGPVCVMGMGPLGTATRWTLPALGSALTYGWLDRPVAPGQPSCEELMQHLRG